MLCHIPHVCHLSPRVMCFFLSSHFWLLSTLHMTVCPSPPLEPLANHSTPSSSPAAGELSSCFCSSWHLPRFVTILIVFSAVLVSLPHEHICAVRARHVSKFAVLVFCQGRAGSQRVLSTFVKCVHVCVCVCTCVVELLAEFFIFISYGSLEHLGEERGVLL